MEIKALIKSCLLVLISTTLENASAKLGACTCEQLVLSCGDPPHVPNGEYVLTHPDQDVVGSTAYLDCDPGFQAPQQSQITCRLSGLWDDPASCQTNPFAGTSFVAVFPLVTRNNDDGNNIRRLNIITDQTTQVNISAPFTSFFQSSVISETTAEDFAISYTLSDNATTSNRVITITSDNPINVVTLDSRTGDGQRAFDAWLLRPTDQLSSEYILITTDMAPQYAIVGLTDGTVCSVTRPEEGPRTINLDKHEAIPIFLNSSRRVNDDLTGTIIDCSEIVAVFSGGFFAVVPRSIGGSRDMNLVQLVGVENFYDTCLFAPYEPRNEFEIKVVASEDNTNLTCSNGTTTDITILNRGEKFQEYYTSGSPVVCKADQPILAAQFSVNQNVGDVEAGDSSMVLCVDPDNFLNRYEFFVPDEYVEHRLRLVIDTSDVGQLLLNGSSIVALTTTELMSEGVTWVYVDVAPNAYYVLETANGAFFGAELYVLRKFGQFTHSLGQLYADL